MTRLLFAVLAGGAVSVVGWLGTRLLFGSPLFARRNVRGIDVPVGVGCLAVLAAVAVQAGFSVFDTARATASGYQRAGGIVLIAALGFGLIGLIDDLVGDQGDKGFTGHLRALASGRLTTGSLKLIGGGLIALTVAGTMADGLAQLLVGASVVALAANSANLFDRAPGRVGKVAMVCFVLLVLFTPTDRYPALVVVAGFMGGLCGLFPFDLREHLMLGDAGANPLGAVLGVGVVMTTGTGTQLVVLSVLLAINIAGERVSFSSVIDRVAPLRVLDELGRRPR